MLFFLVSLASAAPDHVAALVPSGAVADITSTGDEAWVAWVTAEGEIVVLDTATWTPWNAVADTGASAVAVAIGGGDAPVLFAAMDDQTLGQWSLESGVGPTWMTGIGVSAPPLALEADDTSVYAVLDDPESGAVVMGYDVVTGSAKYESVYDLADSGFEAMEARYTTDSESGARTITYLYVLSGGANINRVQVSASGLSGTSSAINEGSQDLQDLWLTTQSTTVWLATQGAYSVGYLASDTAEIDIIFLSEPALTDVTAVGGLDTDGGWLALAAADGVHFYAYEGSTSIGDEAQVLDVGSEVTGLRAINGYGFVAAADGVSVVTDRPWVEISTVSADTVTTEETVEIGFVADVDGSYQVYRQVQGGGDGPEAVAGGAGTVVAGEPATASFTLPASEDGGDLNYLVEVQVTDDAGFTGRDGTFVQVDEVPEALELSASTVTFGDQVVRVSVDALSAGVADSYQVWISTVEWDPADYPTGGPEYEGPDTDPGEIVGTPDAYGTFEVTIGGLTNGQTYYVALRAYDEDQEGAMSNVIAVTPEETWSLSQRLGLEGFCGLPLFAAGWCGAAAAAGAVFARRGRSVVRRSAMFGVVALAAAAAPGVAQARPHEDDLTPRSWNFEVRYGPFLSQSNTALTDTFGSSDNRLLRAEIGWTRNLVEVDFNFGLYSDSGGQTTESGESSSDEDTLTAVPFALDATVRLDLFKEQPVVPFARAGIDYWLWNETWVSDYDADGGGDTTDGSPGWHWGAGLYLLLDPLDQASASRLETVAGVNDTYLVAEYRQTYALGTDALDFTSTELTFGLKFDY